MMYNRYIPQPDGSYRRNRVPEPVRHRPPPPKPVPVVEDCTPEEPPSRERREEPMEHRPAHRRREGSADGFLRQLLPKDFDTGDLIVVLLLLLMAGDNPEDRNNALLTLAFYFLM